MKRNYNWLPLLVVVVGLLGYRVVWPWLQDRQQSAPVDELIVRMETHAEQARQRADSLPPVPPNATRDELKARLETNSALYEQDAQQFEELHGEIEKLLPKTRGSQKESLREAANQYLTRFRQTTDSYEEHLAQLRTQVEAHRKLAREKRP